MDRYKPRLVAKGFHQRPGIYYHDTFNPVEKPTIVCVDDIIIKGNIPSTVQHFITMLSHQFFLKDLGPLTYFLGVEVLPHQLDLILSQRRYVVDLLARVAMTDAHPISTLLLTSPTLSLKSSTVLCHPSEFLTIVGSL